MAQQPKPQQPTKAQQPADAPAANPANTTQAAECLDIVHPHLPSKLRESQLQRMSAQNDRRHHGRQAAGKKASTAAVDYAGYDEDYHYAHQRYDSYGPPPSRGVVYNSDVVMFIQYLGAETIRGT